MPKTLNRSHKQNTSAHSPAKKHTHASRTRALKPRATSIAKKVTPALLQEMTQRLVNEFDPEQVILFGSYAWGKPTNDSDVDLMVIVSKSDERETHRMTRGLYCLRGLGVSKDVFVKTRAEFEYFRDVKASLQNRIAEKGKVLYDNTKKPSSTEMVRHR